MKIYSIGTKSCLEKRKELRDSVVCPVSQCSDYDDYTACVFFAPNRPLLSLSQMGYPDIRRKEENNKKSYSTKQ